MLKSQSDEHFREALARAIVETVEFPRGVFVTLADAKIAANQKNAMGLISVFPFERHPEALRALETYRHDMKDALARSLKLRKIPNIEWKVDEREENVGKIDETIEELRAKGDL